MKLPQQITEDQMAKSIEEHFEGRLFKNVFTSQMSDSILICRNYYVVKGGEVYEVRKDGLAEKPTGDRPRELCIAQDMGMYDPEKELCFASSEVVSVKKFEKKFFK